MGVDITIKLFLNKNKEEILKIILNQTEELQELYMEVKNSLNEETIKLIKNNGGAIKENMLGKSKLCTFNVNKENDLSFLSEIKIKSGMKLDGIRLKNEWIGNFDTCIKDNIVEFGGRSGIREWMDKHYTPKVWANDIFKDVFGDIDAIMISHEEHMEFHVFKNGEIYAKLSEWLKPVINSPLNCSDFIDTYHPDTNHYVLTLNVDDEEFFKALQQVGEKISEKDFLEFCKFACLSVAYCSDELKHKLLKTINMELLKKPENKQLLKSLN